jgi:predicted nucleic acid-binding protein
LDSGPLSLLTHPKPLAEFTAWFNSRMLSDDVIMIPEIADYEVRRELLRARKLHSVARLDTLYATVPYLPLTTADYRLAAQFWADARNAGVPTADSKALDADVILAAQATNLRSEFYEPVVVTTNLAHLARFVPASEWQSLS